MNKKINFFLLILLLTITITNKAFAEEKDPHFAFFKANHKSNFLSKLFSSPNKTTHAELMITPSYRKSLLDRYPDIEVPEWDNPSILTKIIIFKTPSSGFMDSAKTLRPIRFGLANREDQVIISAENEGLYELTDCDVEYIENVYGIKVDNKNRHSLIAFYQPTDLIREDLAKRLIAFENTDNHKVDVSVLKYNRDYYNALIRADYKWVGVIDGNIEEDSN
jgi:hypothetical protein